MVTKLNSGIFPAGALTGGSKEMKYLHPHFLNLENAALLIIDIQDRLFPLIHEDLQKNMLKNVPILVKTARELKMPVVVTEQYPKGIGRTVKPILDLISGYPVHEKLEFAATETDGFHDVMASLGRRKIVLVGMETHICVYQTTLGLIDLGYDVHLVRDAAGSRTLENYSNGLELAHDAGAIVTNTESVMFQLLKVSGTPEFKKLQQLII